MSRTQRPREGGTSTSPQPLVRSRHILLSWSSDALAVLIFSLPDCSRELAELQDPASVPAIAGRQGLSAGSRHRPALRGRIHRRTLPASCNLSAPQTGSSSRHLSEGRWAPRAAPRAPSRTPGLWADPEPRPAHPPRAAPHGAPWLKTGNPSGKETRAGGLRVPSARDLLPALPLQAARPSPAAPAPPLPRPPRLREKARTPSLQTLTLPGLGRGGGARCSTLGCRCVAQERPAAHRESSEQGTVRERSLPSALRSSARPGHRQGGTSAPWQPLHRLVPLVFNPGVTPPSAGRGAAGAGQQWNREDRAPTATAARQEQPQTEGRAPAGAGTVLSGPPSRQGAVGAPRCRCCPRCQG